MKKNSYFFVFVFVLFVLTSCKSIKNKETMISGFFLFEINIPNNFHTDGDVIKQEGLIVITEKKNLNYINFDSLYKDGIINLYDNNLIQTYNDTLSKNNLIVSLQRCIYDYENKENNYKYLCIKERCYLPFKADFFVTYIGRKKWLVPKTLNYECCNSNEEKLIKTYKVNKILNFKIIQDW